MVKLVRLTYTSVISSWWMVWPNTMQLWWRGSGGISEVISHLLHQRQHQCTHGKWQQLPNMFTFYTSTVALLF